MKKVVAKLFLLLFIASCGIVANAQTVKVSGTAVGSSDRQPLIRAIVSLVSLKDSTQKHLTISDTRGSFVIPNVSPQKYRLDIRYMGFTDFSMVIAVGNSNLALGIINLKEKSQLIGGATITGQAVRASVKGDTTIYSADAYKVNKDASAEELITKMPGITTDNNTIKAQGEQVKKILVDGKPFFGDDPTVAIKNVPAEIIEKIEVFDKLSDQAAFTGFDDGNSTKTLNIVTKSNKRTGQFGKIYAGYGSDNRYNAGGNVNLFKGDSRISLIGMSNNVNQQNFSSEDILGVLGGSGGRGGMRGGPGVGPGGAHGGGASNFMVGQQSGITKTTAFGINYSDKWGEKVNFSGSYFFNYSNTTNNQKTNRQYYGAIDTAQHYTYTGVSDNNNYNNRANFRIEYAINPKNSFIFTPSISFQSSRSSSSSNAQTTLGPTALLNKSDNENKSLSDGYNINNEILFRHKFEKDGRTLSVSLRNSWSNKDGNSSLYAENAYYRKNGAVLDTINQKSTLTNKSYSIGTTINYTEPIGKKSQLMTTYDAGYTFSDVDKRTKAYNRAIQQYNLLDTSLSNVYQSDYITQRLGLAYRVKGDKYNGMLNLSLQNANLYGDETFPVDFNLKKSYNNVLPMAMMNFKFNQANSLRLMYGTRTQAPSISQLQSVVDNSDPLNLYVGNPNLNQSYSNSINLRYSYTSMTKGKTFFVFFNAQNTIDYIGTSTLLAGKDITLSNGTILKKGAQLSSPVNLNGYWTLNTMITYGFPVSLIKSNINLSAGTGYTRYPAILNNQKVLTKTYSPNGGIVIGSNISQDVDFTASYNTAYNVVDATNSNGNGNNYWSQTGRFKLNWTIANRFTVMPEAIYQQYNGNSFYYDNLTLNFNAGVKFLKNRQAEVKFGVFDLLDKNKSFSRSVNSLYIEDNYSSVLSRYFLVTLVFNLRSFKGMASAPQQDRERHYDRPFDRPDRPMGPPDRPLDF
jgi:hypothetical protein